MEQSVTVGATTAGLLVAVGVAEQAGVGANVTPESVYESPSEM
jgi:hypothetical protein